MLLSEAGYRTARADKYHTAPEAVYRFDEEIPSGDASPEELADRCLSVFARRDARPFFLFFCTTEPHRPFRCGGSRPVSLDDVIVPPYLPDIPECRQELARYYMSVERADRGLVRRPDRAAGTSNAMVTWADLAPTLLDLAGALPEEAAFHGRSFAAAMTERAPEGWDEIFASHTFHEITM